MTEYAVVNRWDQASKGAPQKRLEEIRGFVDDYFADVAKFDITPDNYLLAAREALVDSRELIEGSVRSRSLTHRNGPGEALWSTIVATIDTLLFHFGRRGWAVFWAGNRALRRVFGLRERAVWERLRMVRDIEWLETWHRAGPDEHDYEAEEALSNVYFLRIPAAIWEFWTAMPKAKRFLAKLNRGAAPVSGATADAATGSRPEGQAPRSSAAPSMPPRSARQRAGAAADASGSHWFPELFHRLRAKRYTTDGGKISEELLIPIEKLFEGAAAVLHAKVLAQGQEPPALLVLRDELATAAVLHWFTDPGANDFLLRTEHPIGPFSKNAAAEAKAAAAWWWEAWKKAHPPKPLSLREPYVPRAPLAAAHAIAGEVAAQAAAQPSQPRAVLRQAPLTERQRAEWEACRLAEEASAAEACEDAASAEVAAPAALADLDVSGVPELTDDEPLDLEGDFETMESAVDQRPDPVPD